MAKKQEPAAEQPTAEASDAQETGEMLNELREAYEQARVDLKQTSDRLRSEINKIDLEEAGDAAKTWVKDNPGLAFLMAVGAGMVVGRALTKALEPPPPPSLSQRARQKSSYLTNSARQFAGDTVDRFSAQAAAAGEQMADRVRSTRGSIYDRAGSLGDLINQRAGDLGHVANEKTGEIISSFSDAAERAADSLQVAATDLSKTIKKQKGEASSLYESLLQSAKTVFSAFVFKRISDWIRTRY
ncbi:MAG: hypothetical protein AAF564_08085 [Bacteroidota bacterium]